MSLIINLHKGARFTRDALVWFVPRALKILLPWACAGCRRTLDCVDDQGFCGPCWLSIPRIYDLVCQKCGVPLPDGGALCFNCKHEPPRILIRAATEYKGIIPTAIYRFKYAGRKTLAPALSRLLEGAWNYFKELQTSDLLIPVPLHQSNKHHRGFNQAELLAIHLSSTIGRPVLSNTLSRTRKTKPQYRLGKEERRKNIIDSFSFKGSLDLVKGKRILLIDDICTTGSTFNECAKILRKVGAQNVCALALARDALNV